MKQIINLVWPCSSPCCNCIPCYGGVQCSYVSPELCAVWTGPACNRQPFLLFSAATIPDLPGPLTISYLTVASFEPRQKTYAHRQVIALQFPPPSKCKEGSHQESLRQGQEHHATEGRPAERRTPDHYIQTEWLPLTIHSCHLLLLAETYHTIRGGEAATSSNPICKWCE